MLRYTIVSDMEMTFAHSVEEAIKDGWKPQGGVAVSNGEYTMLYQAMVKEE